MPRIARVVAAGLPHHVTQRGNRRQRTFFCNKDYEAYLELMADWCSRCGVEVNPVKAGLVRRPRQYPWSSAAAHLKGRDNALVRVEPLLELAGDWGKFLSQPVQQETARKLQAHERTGRPLGSDGFVAKLERHLHRVLLPRKPGRKPKEPRRTRSSRK